MLDAQRINGLVARYADGPARLDAALAGLSPDEARFAPDPEQWSIHEIVVHLADTDLAAAARIRHILGEPGATLVAFDQNEWARAMPYASQPLDAAIALFRAVRTSTAALLRQMPAKVWQYTGMHTQNGPQTLEWIVEHFADHLDGHLTTIEKRRRQHAR